MQYIILLFESETFYESYLKKKDMNCFIIGNDYVSLTQIVYLP